jgi:hypothetical protein
MTEIAQKQPRCFPITPCLKRLFISKRTTRHMRWNKEGISENDGVMGHPLDSEAWKVLDRFDVDFFSTNSTPYSCWPIFAAMYNLPPSLYMKFKFMFLCLIVPGPEAPDPRINMMLKLLIEELKQLWIGVEAYDCYKKQKFRLQTAYLWSVHDFKAYDVFAGWSIHGELTCPICDLDTDYFCLTHGGKISYFNCHRRWLPRKHNFKQEQNAFWKDTTATKGPSKHLRGKQIINMLDKLMPDPERPEYFEGYGETHN